MFVGIKVPQHCQDKLLEIFKDEDGWWATLKKGWHFANMECHTAHERTKADLMKCLRKDNIIPVEEDWD